MSYDTQSVYSWVRQCDSIEELEHKIMPLLTDQRVRWADKIRRIMAQRGFSVRQMAQLCRVSEPAVRKWLKGSLPQSRDMYIRIGFAAGFSLEEMDRFLMRYGRCPHLYVKSPEDMVCIFILWSRDIPHTYTEYQRLLNIVRTAILTSGSNFSVRPTAALNASAQRLHSADQMQQFAADNAASFRSSYAQFYRYVKNYLRLNLNSEVRNPGDGRKASFHAMATESKWSSSLRHCISEIRAERWFPLRNKVISLGLHLNMDLDAINHMLRCAKMEPLYVMNPIEAAVIWAVEDAKLSSLDDAIIPDGSSELCEYVKSVLIRLHLSESEFLIDDL